MAQDVSIEVIEQEALLALQAKLGIRALDLQSALRRAGRRLPRDAHRAGDVVIAAIAQLAHPKLSRLVDMRAVEQAAGTLHLHLDKIDPKERRKDWILSMLGAQVFNLLAVAALVLALMAWRGFL